MLLNSSEVSMILSSIVVVICGIAIFVAGFVVQQDTVQHLHTTLGPRNPLSQVQIDPNTGKYIRESRTEGSPSDFDWRRLAYAQVVKSHDQVCDALVILHELYMSHSSAPRLLLFPQPWIRERSAADPMDDQLDRSLQLIKKAARLYRTTLVPIETLATGRNESDPAEYSIASAYSLIQYEQVMILPTPSLILNSRPLDSILAYHSTTQHLTVYPSAQQISPESLLLVTPSKREHERLKRLRVETDSSDSDLLLAAFPDASVLSSATDALFNASLYSNLEVLQAQRFEDRFNADVFFDETAIFRINHPKLPGPEFDAPYQDVVDLRPKDEDQGFVWENLYSTYKDRRYQICGLNPKPWKAR